MTSFDELKRDLRDAIEELLAEHHVRSRYTEADGNHYECRACGARVLGQTNRDDAQRAHNADVLVASAIPRYIENMVTINLQALKTEVREVRMGRLRGSAHVGNADLEAYTRSELGIVEDILGTLIRRRHVK